MIVLVIGGSKSGKSSLAENISYNLKKEGILYYLATMNPKDLEDLKRIEKHISSREKYNFKTIEIKSDIKMVKDIKGSDTMLLDSVTSLVTNEMFKENNFNLSVKDKITSEVESLSKRLKNLILVSDYVFSDSKRYDELTNNFRKELGSINCTLASLADVVIEVNFGNIIFHKGEGVLDV
ncbi:bifunctional adenosylcobinamide kinase/adenosylcobinamide-phosphate guanylyltransferase [Clostridium chrysemydis]|uniref:bifunctional adenosylcobinamide kinase/adenosylcobinamide-phosphate guanylyltransferase n=1 Tax=Clostridium chrysemydis TaxID=2665504 RepID=UPI0018842156|nr:bifunctional adenosylcobinamide kinase/adenosylcobinamide-phosphate guanylyltransferase [Clostridium chrysemydis]